LQDLLRSISNGNASAEALVANGELQSLTALDEIAG